MRYELPDWPARPIKPIPGLPLPPHRNDAWPEWADKVMAHRLEMHRQLTEPWSRRDDVLRREAARIMADGRYLVNTYFGIYEARAGESGRASSWITPFILYPFQDYTWDWIEERMETTGVKGDGVVVKARDMGATNLCCAFGVAKWLTTRPYQARFLSRKEDMVHDTFSTDSMFWKIEYFLKSMPQILLQAFIPGFDWKIHKNAGKIANPLNSNALLGESTNATAGRGSRCTQMFLDEMAFMRGLSQIWTATRPATYHRLGVSSVGTSEGMLFHDLVEGSKTITPDRQPAILRMHSYLHPMHDFAWHEAERSRDTESGYRQEVLMDWFADVDTYVYPMAGDKKVGDYGYIPYAGPIICAIDDGFENDWAMIWFQFIKATGRHHVIAAYKNSGQIADFYGSICTGVPRSDFRYGLRERQIMAQVRTWPAVMYCGDPHGENTETTSGKSVYDVLYENWGIMVVTPLDHKEKFWQKQRINRLGPLIPYMDFDANEGVAEALHSLKFYRWKKMRDGAELTSEYKTPSHDRNSHDAQAMEAYADFFLDNKSMLSGGGGFVYHVDSLTGRREVG